MTRAALPTFLRCTKPAHSHTIASTAGVQNPKVYSMRDPAPCTVEKQLQWKSILCLAEVDMLGPRELQDSAGFEYDSKMRAHHCALLFDMKNWFWFK